MLNPRRMLALAALAWTVAAPARAETYEVHPGDDLRGRLASLEPGDEVIIHAGTYPQTSRFEATWAGTEVMPIVIRGADGEARPVLMRDSGLLALGIGARLRR